MIDQYKTAEYQKYYPISTYTVPWIAMTGVMSPSLKNHLRTGSRKIEFAQKVLRI